MKLILLLKKIYSIISKKHIWYDESNVQFFNQEANDYVFKTIEEAFKYNKGLMISKFGTIELTSVISVLKVRNGIKIGDYIKCIKGEYDIFPSNALRHLCNNAGFFPNSNSLHEKYVDLVLNDIKEIDVLASYIDMEKYLDEELKKSVKINLEGYYAPFLWKNPWTKVLKNKRVLVIHPFTESIEKQYQYNREKLFENIDVLPEFKELLTIKAVQSIAGNGANLEFKDWFEALQYMETQIDKLDFDIALIGCGAYGMNLAAYIKRKGKIAVHLAGWTQMLFGIYGNRWIEDQPEYIKYINEYWVRPLENEKPQGLNKVENGCYW
ncbi:MAG: hypothetical protein IKF52_02220 [Clostridia bacterium]|nr:hypothetical protein [Clostridia bacterium]